MIQKLPVMRYENHRTVISGQHLLQQQNSVHIQIRRWFIRKKKWRMLRKCCRDCEPGLLPAAFHSAIP
jgi:hypothetical protein